MAAYKLLKDLKKNLKETEEMVPVNWLGKWYKSVRTKSIKDRIQEIESELKDKKVKSCCAHELESQKEEAEMIAVLEKQLKK